MIVRAHVDVGQTAGGSEGGEEEGEILQVNEWPLGDVGCCR